MSNHKDSNFQDRLSRASEAKAAMLAKFKRALDPENPTAIAAARAKRAVQREAARQEKERELARQAEMALEAAAAAKRAAAELEARGAAGRVA